MTGCVMHRVNRSVAVPSSTASSFSFHPFTFLLVIPIPKEGWWCAFLWRLP